MKINKNVTEILKLSLEEKINAVETIWDNIADENATLPLNEGQIQILNDRLEMYKKNPESVRLWDDFKNDFLNRK
jgi:putative addiction module component (TIGR02574 family)